MRSIAWWHFQWPWRTPNPIFKVEYRKNGASYRQSYYCTRGKIPNIWNGTLFSDLDWPLSASRGFVSISCASCSYCLDFSVRRSEWVIISWQNLHFWWWQSKTNMGCALLHTTLSSTDELLPKPLYFPRAFRPQ